MALLFRSRLLYLNTLIKTIMTIPFEYPLRTVCPKCNLKIAEQISRGSLFKLFFFWLPVKRFNCHSCKYNFFRRISRIE